MIYKNHKDFLKREDKKENGCTKNLKQIIRQIKAAMNVKIAIIVQIAGEKLTLATNFYDIKRT